MYRGKQIAPARVTRVSKKEKIKSASTKSPSKHVHEHAPVEHANALIKAKSA
jgi:hypothetical protein